MLATFLDATTRSADDASADLRACRQLRHVSTDDLAAVAASCFGRLPFVRVSKAFSAAFRSHGYSCDTCDTVTMPVPDKLEYAANRALDNMDGRAKLMLCKECSDHFRRFCNKTFDRDPITPYGDDLERMMLAWVAFRVICEQRRQARAA